ncbi:MAG: Anthranilate/para-aminobenzoate synthase component I TrpE [Candidatus Methanohalarchaeum thermophilum]|uniref:anthranilate synthase n=1 Tax=Methanohalarchaeum thermophilum TaxID=1903181 RepID=A0A1Q6DSB7_METT1|nr:MAG: Anthranilate/para-aminobenzoate synthase component I TrpE [Candidatus Methanohalarchaeum thermophilum]
MSSKPKLHPVRVKKKPKKEIDPGKIYKEKGKGFLLETKELESDRINYSLLSIECNDKIQINQNNTKVTGPILEEQVTETDELNNKNPVNRIKSIFNQINVYNPTFPRFAGGIVGYFSFETIHQISNKLKEKNLNHPLAEFYFPKKFLKYNHSTNELSLIKYLKDPDKTQIKSNRRKLSQELQEIESMQQKQLKHKKIEINKINSNYSQKEYEDIVEKAKRYIQEGETYQIVLSRRIDIPVQVDPLELYFNLRKVNPSSYLYHLDFDERKIIGSSPEMLVRSSGNKVETVPIAGTISRGRNKVEDKKLAQELLQDPKEKSEHVMLVDLARNDLGRVSEIGSVRVKDFKRIKKFSHVQHITSKVIARLKKEKDMFDAFRSCFPAGTVSGAPKLRSIQVIDELEKDPRGPYSGAVGYFSFNEEMDFAITIRTFHVKENEVQLQVGAGIVKDSVPRKEWKETIDKGKAGMKALRLFRGDRDE